MDSKIIDVITKALLEISKEHDLTELEIKKLAFTINSVAKSSPEIRNFFFLGIAALAQEIQNILAEQKKELLKLIKNDDDDKGNILN